jgi:hypothetical protein
MISREYFSEDSLTKFVEISIKVYGEEELLSKVEFVRNKHLGNPDGESVYLELKQNELPTGRIAIQFRKAAKGASEIIRRNPVDLVSFGNNPFGGLNLYKESLVQEENVEPSGVYHTSNPKSEIFYRRILKEEPVAELSYRAIPLSPVNKDRVTYFLKPVAGFFRLLLSIILMSLSSLSKLEILGSSRSTDNEMDILFEEQDELFLLRDKERLNWRFPNIDPEAEYVRIEFFKQKKFCGYLVFRKIEFNGCKAMVIVDLYTLGLNRFDFGRIYRTLISFAQGMNLIFTVANFENKKLRMQFPFPFFRVPKRFEPQNFPIYSPKTNRVSDLNKGTYLTLFDLDVL